MSQIKAINKHAFQTTVKKMSLNYHLIEFDFTRKNLSLALIVLLSLEPESITLTPGSCELPCPSPVAQLHFKRFSFEVFNMVILMFFAHIMLARSSVLEFKQLVLQHDLWRSPQLNSARSEWNLVDLHLPKEKKKSERYVQWLMARDE